MREHFVCQDEGHWQPRRRRVRDSSNLYVLRRLPQATDWGKVRRPAPRRAVPGPCKSKTLSGHFIRPQKSDWPGALPSASAFYVNEEISGWPWEQFPVGLIIIHN